MLLSFRTHCANHLNKIFEFGLHCRIDTRNNSSKYFLNPLCITNMGQKEFFYIGHSTWNSLPDSIKKTNSLNTFKRAKRCYLTWIINNVYMCICVYVCIYVCVFVGVCLYTYGYILVFSFDLSIFLSLFRFFACLPLFFPCLHFSLILVLTWGTAIKISVSACFCQPLLMLLIFVCSSISTSTFIF